MKKVLLLITVLMMTVSMSAQNLTASKTTDNFYIGINGGVATKTTGHAWLKGLNPNAQHQPARNNQLQQLVRRL